MIILIPAVIVTLATARLINRINKLEETYQ